MKEVPRSYIRELLASREAALHPIPGAPLEQAAVTQKTWGGTCGTNDMYMADSSWLHYTCAHYDGVSSTGLCGNLNTWVRYYGTYPNVYYWGGNVYYFWPGNFDGCWTHNSDCTGTGENFLSFANGGTTDPNGSGSGWTTSDGTVQTSHSIYAQACVH